MSKVIMIFIDAFSSTYLTKDKAPFLYSLKQQGYIKCIRPLPAFMGIGTTLFSGTWPETNGAWTNFISKHNDKKRHSIESKIFTIFDFIPNDRLSWDCRYILLRLLNKPIPIPNQIPSFLVDYFKSKVETSIFKDNSLGNIPTIFDCIRHAGKNFTVINKFNDSDETITKRTIEYLKMGNYSDLTYLKYGSLDTYGHIFGPTSDLNLKRIKMIDNSIKQIVEMARNCNERFDFVIFSDHGMSPVTDYVDILKLLKQNTSLKLVDDYLVFVDSTMARFWFTNQKARETIIELLSEIKYGEIIPDSYFKENKLPLNKIEHGELVFALKEGIVMHPDFFHKNTIMKGMHGHLKSNYDQPILLTYPTKPNKENGAQVSFVDVTPTTLKLLNVAISKKCEGESLI